jgi:hypothetical protein
MHEPTPTAELKRLFRNSLEQEFDSLPPGMNVELQNKYGFDILIHGDADFWSSLKPGVLPSTPPLMQPEAWASLLRRATERQADRFSFQRCNSDAGWPAAGMVSEPIKIVQAAKETMILYEVGNLHRQIFIDDRAFPVEFDLPAYPAIRSAIGRATRSLWKRTGSTIEHRSMP